MILFLSLNVFIFPLQETRRSERADQMKIRAELEKERQNKQAVSIKRKITLTEHNWVGAEYFELYCTDKSNIIL